MVTSNVGNDAHAHKSEQHTRAAEIPPGHPFGDWTDDDFRQFEASMATTHAERRCNLCGEPMGSEDGSNHRQCEDYENSPAWEMPDDVYEQWMESHS